MSETAASDTSFSSTSSYVVVPRPPKTDPQKIFHYTDLQRTKPTRENDPFTYLSGFGARHQSEVIPGTLPTAQNNPHENRYGLYTEGITYSAFAARREENRSTYMYRVRPSAAHNGYSKVLSSKSHIENCFLSLNPKMETLPEQQEWSPFPLPSESESIDFTDGLHTLAGSGDPNLKDGIALYIYAINASMSTPSSSSTAKKSFVNQDGDFLFCTQLGNLILKTEMGNLFLQPGEIAVIPRGVRFAVDLADDMKEARGYITEIWGSSWTLPDLGPLGGHGLANPRDFLFPEAAIDEHLHDDWEVVCKLNGALVKIEQDHSPFDVVAWHGNVVPYKYDLTKFVSQNSTSVDHTDPSVNTVLTALSPSPGQPPLADFLWFGPRWDVASNSLRLPYYHRNSASEFLACLYGNGLGRSDDFKPGGGSFEGGHTPHGGNDESYVIESQVQENQPRRILENQMTIMVESGRTWLWTEWGREGCGVRSKKATDPKEWDKTPDRFSTYPGIANLLARVKAEKEAEKERLEYYHQPHIGRF